MKKFDHNPLDKMVYTQKFGERPEYYEKYGLKGHNGIDLKTRFPDSPNGKRPVYAVMDGEVNELGPKTRTGYGMYIRLKHADLGQTVYAHLCLANVILGQKVTAGETIGTTDNTGDSNGPHLHFGFRPSNFIFGNGFKGYIDPEEFFV